MRKKNRFDPLRITHYLSRFTLTHIAPLGLNELVNQ